jgi:hypothetical protein
MITNFFYGKENSIGNIYLGHNDFQRVPHAMIGLAAAAVSPFETFTSELLHLTFVTKLHNCIEEFMNGYHKSIPFSRDPVTTKEGQTHGYAGYYQDIVATLDGLKEKLPKEYEVIMSRTDKWILNGK